MTEIQGRKKSKKRKRIVWATILSFLCAIGLYYFCYVCPLICELSQEKARSLSTCIISEVVGDVIASGEVDYGELVKITYTSQNTVGTIEVDTICVNKLVRAVTKEVQQRVDELKNNCIGISLGTFTGIPFLYGRGPEISIKILPIGRVGTDIHSSLSSCGINQSQHRLYFTISACLGLVLPTKTQEFTTSQDVLVCENIIVGQIPSVYFGDNLI